MMTERSRPQPESLDRATSRFPRHNPTDAGPRQRESRLRTSTASGLGANSRYYGTCASFVWMAALNSSIESVAPALAACLFLPSWDTLLSGSPSLVVTTSRPLD